MTTDNPSHLPTPGSGDLEEDKCYLLERLLALGASLSSHIESIAGRNAGRNRVQLAPAGESL